MKVNTSSIQEQIHLHGTNECGTWNGAREIEAAKKLQIPFLSVHLVCLTKLEFR